MNIQITGRHVQITDAIKQFTEEKILSLSKFVNKINKIHVMIDVQNNIHHKCEMNFEGNHLHLSAHAETKNMYESISKCIDKMAQQLKSHKFTYSDKTHRKSTKDFEMSVLENESLAIEETISE